MDREGDAEDVNRVVSVASKAFDEGPWPKMIVYEKSRIILCFADLLEKHTEEVASLETWDNGKPYEQAVNTEILIVVRSTPTGKIVLGLVAKSNLKLVTLELGRKSPFIGWVVLRWFPHFSVESVYDEFVEKAKAQALKRVVRNPFKKGIEQGSQVDNEQFQKILKYLRSGIESGVTLESGGE
ncbi:hypothetical protein CRYUN_Cryun08bG0086900 [Craigia yunnanensis]